MAGTTATYPFVGGGGGSGVTSLNSLTGAVDLIAGTNITLTPSGNNITIASASGSGNISGTWTSTGNVVTTDGAATAQDSGTALSALAPLASPSFTGDILFGNYHVEPSEYDAGSSGTSLTVDLSAGSGQRIELTGDVTLTLTNPQTGGAYVLKIIQGSSPYTVTWPASVKWPGGTAPVITTGAGQVDLINLYYDGTDYFGSFAQNYPP